MSTPPFLLGCALVFWGWHSGFLAGALPMAVAVESSRFIKTRWEFSEKDLYRVWDLCALLFFGGLIFFYASDEVRNAFAFVQWLPFFFFPILMVQAFSADDAMDLRVFSWFLRRHARSSGKRRFNIAYSYFSVCLISAGATNSEGLAFYYGLVFLVGWALWAARSRRFSPPVTVILMIAITAGGLITQRGMRELQGMLETVIGNWFTQRAVNMGKSNTSIGQIGRLKLSGKIVLRVEPPGRSSPPERLREASYTRFEKTTWLADNRGEFGKLPVETNFVWKILPETSKTGSVTLSRYLAHGEGVLALPHGVSEIRELPAAEVSTNRLGGVRVKDGPGFIRIEALYGPGVSSDRPPTLGDTEVPERERLAIRALAREMGLYRMTNSEQKLRAIEKTFADKFKYSTYLSTSRGEQGYRQTPLGFFLQQSRAGHCEYFATATVLLLREAGLPARYVTGFAVQEATRDRHQFVVRDRHAHAWTLVYRNNHWEEFDTTPASWEEIERHNASFFEPLADLWSRLRFEFSKWRYSKENYRQYLVWALIPLIAILVWRIVFQKSRRRVRNVSEAERAAPVWPGTDSDFYLVERELERRGLTRASAETVRSWLNRLEPALAAAGRNLSEIVELHYRYRFDPRGLSVEDRAQLHRAVERWLEEWKTSEGAPMPAVGASHFLQG